LGERVVRNDEVSGSIPLSSTTFRLASRQKANPFSTPVPDTAAMRKVLPFLMCTFLAVGQALAAGGGGHGGDGKKSKTPAKRQVTTLVSWVDIDPFTVSVIQRQGVSGTFMVAFGIDVPDEGLRAKAEAILPRLRNNWLLAINQYASANLRPRMQADLDGLTSRLQRVADETLGKPGAKVLLSNAIVQIK
jgi:hypothetical protein